MLGKVLSCCVAFAIAASTLLAADSAHPSANFNVSELTAVPGKTLPPGSYTISVVDHLSDRYIVRVEGSGIDSTLFLGLPNKSLPQKAGEIKWAKGAEGAQYIRGWDFPSVSLEFAYPKNDAVALAKANSASVPAIDPESEGMNTKASLSQDEMHIVTLWLLSPTRVGPSAPAGISAARYQQVASVEHKPVVAKLPHTASVLPAIWLLGMLSVMGGLSMRFLRLSR